MGAYQAEPRITVQEKSMKGRFETTESIRECIQELSRLTNRNRVSLLRFTCYLGIEK